MLIFCYFLIYFIVKIVLVHDQATCFFPGENEQPDDLKQASVFHDKAITFMSQYTSHCTRQILKKVNFLLFSQKCKTHGNFIV